MKKFVSIILAACLFLFGSVAFVACDKDAGDESAEHNGKYYAYDIVSEEYNEKDCMELKGKSCTMIATVFGMQMTASGTVKYDGKSVVVSITIGEDDFTMNIVMYGEIEAKGVIRFFRQEVTSGDETATDNITEYYCKKGCAPKKQEAGENDGVYFAYDPSAEQFDDGDTITINGGACKFSAYLDIFDVTGTAEFNDNNFIFDCTGLGVRMVYMGVKEKDGVLRVNSVTTYLDENNGNTDSTVLYYCKKGVTPDNPIIDEQDPPLTGYYKITFDANGGSFRYGSTDDMYTDKDGKVSLPYYSPTRDGYAFAGYNTKKDGSGNKVEDNTRFSGNATVYAQWVKDVTVTFKDNGLTMEKKKVGKGMALGDFPVPDGDGYYFKGWYNGGKQYVSTTVVESNITLTASYYTESEIQSYIDSLDYTTKPGHVYIHYWRNDHLIAEHGTVNTADAPLYSSPIMSETYMDWLVWAWPKDGNARAFYPMEIDMSGAVYDIDYTYVYHDAGADGDLDTDFSSGELRLMLTAGSSMNDEFWKTDGYTQYLFNFRDSYLGYDHVFFLQGKTYKEVYYNSRTGRFIN